MFTAPYRQKIKRCTRVTYTHEYISPCLEYPPSLKKTIREGEKNKVTNDGSIYYLGNNGKRKDEGQFRRN